MNNLEYEYLNSHKNYYLVKRLLIINYKPNNFK